MRQFFFLPGGSSAWSEQPDPEMFPAGLDVHTRASAVSVGTEMSGLRGMKQATTGRRSVGYSAAGVVRAVGPEAAAKGGFAVGQRIACYGGPYTRHASRLVVPWTLATVLPENVSFEEAAFCGLGAIALHALRRGKFTPGERVVIQGMGILGQMAEQILRNCFGCRTLCIDRHDENIELARRMGCGHVCDSRSDDVPAAVKAFAPAGADGVIVNGSLEPPGMDQAADYCRDRGRIVMVGGGGIRVNRDPIFGKEIDLLISRAGGPGRYDAQYEKLGQDLPVGYVRWTEGRNVAEFIEMISLGQVNMKGLITHRLPCEQAPEAFRLLDSPKKYTAMGVVFTYE